MHVPSQERAQHPPPRAVECSVPREGEALGSPFDASAYGSSTANRMETAGEVIANVGVAMEHLDREIR